MNYAPKTFQKQFNVFFLQEVSIILNCVRKCIWAGSHGHKPTSLPLLPPKCSGKKQ